MNEEIGQPDVLDTEDEKDGSSLRSIAVQRGMACKELRMAQMKVNKKRVEIFNVLRVSERRAREV